MFLLHSDTIREDQLHFTSGGFVDISHYTRKILVPTFMQYCSVKLHIPFSGNDTADSRSRIILYFDNEPIADESVYGPTHWVLVPMHIEGIQMNVEQGTHIIRLSACVNKGTLNIPHYNTGADEVTKQPSIFGTYTVIGYPK